MSQVTASTRPYDATSRRAAAHENKQHILYAARRLFAEQGYVTTTIVQIASEASLAPPTVYAAFGSKPGILKALIAAAVNAPDPPDIQDWMDAAVTASTAPERIAHLADGSTEILNRAGDLFAVLHEAKFADPDLERQWEEGQRRRLDGVSRVVRALDEDGLIAVGIDPDRAVDVIWSLTSPEMYTLLTKQRRWSSSRYRTWLGESIAGALGEPNE